MDELRRVFGSFCTEKEISEMLKEADLNGDGEIDFPEFKNIMIKFQRNSDKIKGLWSFCY